MSFMNAVRRFFGLKTKEDAPQVKKFTSMCEFREKYSQPIVRASSIPQSVSNVRLGNVRYIDNTTTVVNNNICVDNGMSLLDTVIAAEMISSMSQPEVVYVEDTSSYDSSNSSCSYDSSDSSSSSCDSSGGSDW